MKRNQSSWFVCVCERRWTSHTVRCLWFEEFECALTKPLQNEGFRVTDIAANWSQGPKHQHFRVKIIIIFLDTSPCNESMHSPPEWRKNKTVCTRECLRIQSAELNLETNSGVHSSCARPCVRTRERHNRPQCLSNRRSMTFLLSSCFLFLYPLWMKGSLFLHWRASRHASRCRFFWRGIVPPGA